MDGFQVLTGIERRTNDNEVMKINPEKFDIYYRTTRTSHRFKLCVIDAKPPRDEALKWYRKECPNYEFKAYGWN